jgi:DNA-binding Lrp family transcriptional regulator
MKIDLKDKRLLFELDSNSRQSAAQIAKKIGLSKEVVNYRIKRLEDEKIITSYQTIINLSALNIIQFKICLALQGIKNAELNTILEILNEKKEVKWIVSCKGNWDLIIALETDSLDGIAKIKLEILEIFGDFIRNKSISILSEAETYSRIYLLDETKEKKTKNIMKFSKEKIPFDDTDLEILKILSKNARKPIIEIAKDLNTTPRIIQYRIKELIEKKIILGFKIAINYEKLGIRFFKTFIYLENPKKDRVKQLLSRLSIHKNVIHNVKVIGNWDLEPEFEVENESEFDKIMDQIKNDFSDIIKNIDIITIQKEYKFVYF